MTRVDPPVTRSAIVINFQQGAAAAASTFDPGAWLGAFTAIGGGYALMADRRLAFLVDDCDGEALTAVMAHIVGRPERQEAIKSVIELRQVGEVAA